MTQSLAMPCKLLSSMRVLTGKKCFLIQYQFLRLIGPLPLPIAVAAHLIQIQLQYFKRKCPIKCLLLSELTIHRNQHSAAKMIGLNLSPGGSTSNHNRVSSSRQKAELCILPKSVSFSAVRNFAVKVTCKIPHSLEARHSGI